VLLAWLDRSNSGSDMTDPIRIGAISRVNPPPRETELMWKGLHAVDVASRRRKTRGVMQPPTRSSRVALAALIAALLYLPGLGAPALWEPDEGRYAEIAREMVVSGDYITPRDNLVRYLEKPPLVYWAEAVAIRLFGANEFAVRLPAALFTIGQVAATCLIGEAMFGAGAGFAGAVVLALCPLVFAFARFATLDPALAFFLTAAVGAFYFAAGCPDFGGGMGRAWMLIAAAMLALGTLAKGPVALILGGAIALIWILVERRGREVRRMPLLSCAAVYAVIVTPWFLLAAMRNPGFVDFFFLHEHLERFVSSREHGWGPYFFIPVAVAGTWPWFFFVPLGISTAREMPEAHQQKARSALRLLAVWFLLIFVFFSIPRSKLGSYILPALPPIAMVSGLALARLGAMSGERCIRLAGRFALLNLAMAAVAIIVLFAIRARIGVTTAWDGTAIAIVIAAGAIAAWALAARTNHAGCVFAIIALAMATTSWLGQRARIHAGATISYRDLARQIRPYEGCVLASYRHFVQALPFYTGRREILVEYWGELAPFAQTPDERAGFAGTAAKLHEVWASHRCVVLIANRGDFEELSKTLDPAPRIIGCEGKKLALYNREVAHAVAGCEVPDARKDRAGTTGKTEPPALGFGAAGL
jgi:4-amino-4-deoxy-L-arabinose transferase-like glycosyltransferase